MAKKAAKKTSRKKAAGKRGRPRQFGKRETISLALPVNFLEMADQLATLAGMSRTRFLIEQIGIALSLHGQYIWSDATGTHFKVAPDLETLKRWYENEASGGKMTFLVHHVCHDKVRPEWDDLPMEAPWEKERREAKEAKARE